MSACFNLSEQKFAILSGQQRDNIRNRTDCLRIILSELKKVMKSNIHKKETHEDKFSRRFACWVKNNRKAWKFWKRKTRKDYRHWQKSVKYIRKGEYYALADKERNHLQWQCSYINASPVRCPSSDTEEQWDSVLHL